MSRGGAGEGGGAATRPGVRRARTREDGGALGARSGEHFGGEARARRDARGADAFGARRSRRARGSPRGPAQPRRDRIRRRVGRVLRVR